MPKVAYSEEERLRIREALVATGLDLLARQGLQHTTVEQIYTAVGISRTFFYSFFPTKEDLIVEALYFQQPKLLAFTQSLADDPALSWREAVTQFLRTCCSGEKNGIAVLTIEEQQLLFRRLSAESRRTFRQKQIALFGGILSRFGIAPSQERIALFTNLSLMAMVLRRAIPDSLPLLVPEAADAALEFQINAIADCLDAMRQQDAALRNQSPSES